MTIKELKDFLNKFNDDLEIIEIHKYDVIDNVDIKIKYNLKNKGEIYGM